MKTEFTLMCGCKSWTFIPYQSLRGIRDGSKRPDKIKIQISEEFDVKEFEKFIDYLVDIRTNMAYETDL